MNDENRSVKTTIAKKNRKIILIALVATLLLLGAMSLIIAILELGQDEPEVETFGTVDPSLLYDTKEEDFDIMEYEKYLALNRTVIYKDSNISVSIDSDSVNKYDAGLQLMYELIEFIIAGDSEGYNSLIYPEEEQEDSFTQQQIYDVVITRYSYSEKQNGSGRYQEYVYKLEYRIHENNGTFRNDIVSDASRPQYFVINDSTGEMLVMDIVESGYLK